MQTKPAVWYFLRFYIHLQKSQKISNTQEIILFLMVMSISSKNNYNVIHDAALYCRGHINTHFSVEGISITCGSPHQHVWSFISGYSEANANANAFLALVAVDQMTVID